MQTTILLQISSTEKFVKALAKARRNRALARTNRPGLEQGFRQLDDLITEFFEGEKFTTRRNRELTKGLKNFYGENIGYLAYQLKDFILDVLKEFGLEASVSVIGNDNAKSALGRNRRESETVAISITAVLTSELSEDFLAPLHRVADNLTKSSTTYKADLRTLFWESDINIIDQWRKFLGSYNDPDTITGRIPMFGEIVEDSFVIFGHRSFIQRFLYGVNFNPDDKGSPANEEFISKGATYPFMFSDVEGENQNNYLHKKDFDVLFRPEMYSNIKNIVEGPRKSLLSTKLGDFYGIPKDFKFRDDFSIQQRDELQETVISTNWPVFRSNTENANVLELDVNINRAYTTALRAGFRRIAQYDPFLSDPDDADALRRLYFPDLDLTSILSDLRENKISSTEALKIFKDKLSGVPLDDPTLKQLIEVFFNTNQESEGPYIPLYDQDRNNPLSIQAMILDAALVDIIDVTVKSLPLFKISTPYFAHRPAVLIGSQANVVGDVGDEKKLANSFYSGIYVLAKWEHEISKDEVSSTFTLRQNINSLTESDVEEILETKEQTSE